jgi:hypothetical protein
MRADDEDFDALADQRFNIRFFLGGIALANLTVVQQRA